MTTPSSVLETGHRELVSAFDDFIRRELVPLAREIPEQSDTVPDDLRDYTRQRSAGLGFYAGDYPEKTGGSDIPFEAVVLLHHAAGRSGCPLAPYALAGADGPSPLLLHGTAGQIERYLVPLVSGRSLRCLAMTEPQAGSDAFRLTTVARRVPSGWQLTGRKTFVSNAARADFALVVADVREKGPNGAGGATVFVMPLGTADGPRIGQRYEGMSGEPLYELLLDDVVVPADAVVGGDAGVGSAMEHAMASLSRGRLILSAQCNGIAEYALRSGVEHAKERQAFGRPIGDYQHVQEHLVTSRAEVEASKLLTLASARLLDAGLDSDENAALAKLTASETALRTVDRALRVHGAAGWVRGHPLEFLYRYVRMMTVVEGTSEIQKVIIAQSMGLG